jgi:hypothetical protein
MGRGMVEDVHARVKLEDVSVTFDDALAVLGLPRDTTWPAVRAAYRARIRTVHPDVSAGSGADAVRLNAAFAVLEPVYRRGVPPPAPAATDAAPPPSATGSATGSAVAPEAGDLVLVDDDSLALVAPADEVFHRLAAVIDEVGALTYADPEAGYLEALIADGTAQLVVSLQGRAHATEAFFTLEPMGAAAVPAIESVVRDLARRLRRGPVAF